MTLTQEQLKKVLSDHKNWLSGTGGSKANLSRANLSRADMSWADLSRADMSRADLSEANLSGANLFRAILSEANLFRASLSGASLSGANLSEANLSEANLSGAILSRADMSWADMSWADLSRARYNLFEILQFNISDITNDLVLELMRWDATICGQDKMSKWANGGSCPFSGNIVRLFDFPEQRELWVSGNPTTSLLELWQWVAKEKNIKI